jgi:hypothetical protein
MHDFTTLLCYTMVLNTAINLAGILEMLESNDYEYPMWLGIGATWCMVCCFEKCLSNKINLLNKSFKNLMPFSVFLNYYKTRVA